ncbi:MAG: hypothetical protein GEU71_16720 [Actinobacteria bacterium]|nr:hypothetical protein [Actinomycetota bacterium]
MNCERFRADRLAGIIGDEDRKHLDECPACRGRVPGLDSGRTALGDPAAWEEPPPELGARVTALVTALPRSPRPWWRRGLLGPISAAAVAIVILGLVVTMRSPAPDWEVAIPGTDLAPVAAGTIEGWNTDTGTRMVMQIDGLDPAPDGFVYELWLSTDTLHVSAGTFIAAERVELTTGVSRADFPRLWVTLEPVDDNESPSGHTVLDTDPH